MGNIGRILAFVITAAAAAGVIIVGSENSGDAERMAASEIRRPVDPNVVVAEDRIISETDADTVSEEANATTPEPALTEAEPETQAKEAPPEPAAGNARKAETAEAESARKPASGETAAARVITDFSLVQEDGGFTLNVIGASPSARVKWFTLESPKRFVIDLAGSWDIRGENVFRVDSGPVRHVVAGVHSDKVRFVVHYREDAVMPGSAPDAGGQEGVLRLTVR